MKNKSIILALLLNTMLLGFSQSFVNLNFENATFVSDPSSSYYPYDVYASNAIPGWTAYIGGAPQSEIFSNNIFLSGSSVAIVGTNWSLYTPIQGRYSILLENNPFADFTNFPPSIGQTGQIPATAQSLIFWGSVGSNDVSFNGQTLSLTVISNILNYNIYGADISQFAGQTGQLLFTAPSYSEDRIDNIQFSSVPVPEPSEFALTALGALLFGFRRWRNS